jgi:hypothetical protein
MLGFLLLVLAAALSVVLGSAAPISVYVVGMLLLTAWRSRDASHLRLYRLIRLRVVGQSLLVLAVVAAAIVLILSLGNPILNFSWYGALIGELGRSAPVTGPGGASNPGSTSGMGGSAQTGGNILLGPLSYPWLIVPFLALLLFLLPRLAATEEQVFRQGTRNWRQALYRSLIFGLAHFPMGIPLGAALALSLGGLWFTYQYFKGGVVRSAVYHLTYNLLALGLVALVLVANVVVNST